MIRIIANSITGRRGKKVVRDQTVREDVFTRVALEAHLKAGNVETIKIEPVKKPEKAKNG